MRGSPRFYAPPIETRRRGYMSIHARNPRFPGAGTGRYTRPKILSNRSSASSMTSSVSAMDV